MRYVTASLFERRVSAYVDLKARGLRAGAPYPAIYPDWAGCSLHWTSSQASCYVRLIAVHYLNERVETVKRATSASTRVETKSERLELRVTPSAKRVIQKAAALSGLSAADLAYEGARRVLNEHEHMELTEADRKVFLGALLSPPKPSGRLITALKRHDAEVE